MKIFGEKMRKLVLFTAVAFIQLVQGRFPEGSFPKCDMEDSRLTQCLSKSINNFRLQLVNGLPNTVPPLDPWKINLLEIDVFRPGLRLKGEAANVVATGARDFNLANLDIDYDRNKAAFTLVFPKLVVTADYSTDDSRAIGFNVQGTGVFSGTFANVVASVQVRGKIDDKLDNVTDANPNGLTHIKLTAVVADVEFGRDTVFHIEPENANFPAKLTAKMINFAPKRLIINVFRENINKYFGELLKTYLNSVLQELPVEDIIMIKERLRKTVRG